MGATFSSSSLGASTASTSSVAVPIVNENKENTVAAETQTKSGCPYKHDQAEKPAKSGCPMQHDDINPYNMVS